MKLIYFYRFIYNEEYAYLCVGNNNTPLPPKSVLSIFCTDLGQAIIIYKYRIGID